MAESSARPSASKALYRASVDSRNPGMPSTQMLGAMILRERMPRRQLAADVPELLEIVVPGALGGFDAERRVAARAAAARHLVAEFLGFRQREEPAKALEATIDELLVDPVILDDDEAELLVGRARCLARNAASRRWRASSVGTASGMGGLLCLPRTGCRSR